MPTVHTIPAGEARGATSRPGRQTVVCSRDRDLEHLAWWGKRKGITVIGTGEMPASRNV